MLNDIVSKDVPESENSIATRLGQAFTDKLLEVAYFSIQNLELSHCLKQLYRTHVQALQQSLVQGTPSLQDMCLWHYNAPV